MNTLHEELGSMSLSDKEDILDTMTDIRNTLHTKLEKLNDQGVYDLELRKKIKTVSGNIEIVKKAINGIL